MHAVDLFFEGQCLIFCLFVFFQLRLDPFTKYQGSYSIMSWALLTIMGNLASDMISLYFNGNPSSAAWWMVRIGNFGYSVLFSVLSVIMAEFTICYFKERGADISGRWIHVIQMVFCISVLGAILNLFTGIFYHFDDHNIYIRDALHPISMLLPMFNTALLWLIICRNRKELEHKEFVVLTLYFVFPLVGAVLQFFYYGHPWINIGIIVSVVIVYMIAGMRSRRERLEVAFLYEQGRDYLLNSQVKTHFLFNSLSVIQGLIEDEPEEAESAISHLARYLRTGLDRTKSEKPVFVREEIDYVRNYLYMQQLRFSERLQVTYDIDESLDFEIPFLSIQQLVENAIRHGVLKKQEGGYLLIRIYRKNGQYVIEVEDDGVGFDTELTTVQTEALKRDFGSGHGLENLRERLGAVYGGNLKVTSIPGKGTKAVITINE